MKCVLPSVPDHRARLLPGLLLPLLAWSLGCEERIGDASTVSPAPPPGSADQGIASGTGPGSGSGTPSPSPGSTPQSLPCLRPPRPRCQDPGPLYMGRERLMIAAQTSGDCNSCHTQAGASAAPGRLLTP